MQAVPFYCPYCAEETIEPQDDDGTYHCDSCDRTFELTFTGLGPPSQ